MDFNIDLGLRFQILDNGTFLFPSCHSQRLVLRKQISNDKTHWTWLATLVNMRGPSAPELLLNGRMSENITGAYETLLGLMTEMAQWRFKDLEIEAARVATMTTAMKEQGFKIAEVINLDEAAVNCA